MVCTDFYFIFPQNSNISFCFSNKRVLLKAYMSWLSNLIGKFITPNELFGNQGAYVSNHNSLFQLARLKPE